MREERQSIVSVRLRQIKIIPKANFLMKEFKTVGSDVDEDAD